MTGSYLHKVGVFGIPDCYHGVNFLNQLLLFIIVKLHVPLGQPRFPSSVLDENEADLRHRHERGKIRLILIRSHSYQNCQNCPKYYKIVVVIIYIYH